MIEVLKGRERKLTKEFLRLVATVEEVRLVYGDRLVAKHRRCWDRERTFVEQIHYLALLERNFARNFPPNTRRVRFLLTSS